MKCATKSRRTWDQLTAADVMERKVVWVSETSPLSDVERLLTEHRISGMPVLDATGRAVGVVSYRDLLDHGAPHGRAVLVKDVMTPAIVDVTTEASVREICATMTKHSVHRVLVTEPGTGRMVGLVTSMGALAALAGG
jgi:CBS domain-containing protein